MHVQVGKSCTAHVAKAQSKKEALAAYEEGVERVQAAFRKGALALEDLKEMVKALRRLPVVDPTLPTVRLEVLGIAGWHPGKTVRTTLLSIFQCLSLLWFTSQLRLKALRIGNSMFPHKCLSIIIFLLFPLGGGGGQDR